MAYDVLGDQTTVLRGGVGLFYDRPFGNSVIFMPGNPPSAKNVTVRYGQLQSLGQGGLTTQGAPGLNTIDYEAKLPSSTQWSAGIQRTIPWATTLDVEWVGQHSFNTVRTANINTVDIGAGFLAVNQDPTKVSATPGGAALATDLMRAYRGYAAVNMRQFNGYRTFHSLQSSVNRRFRDGISFGFNDTWVLHDQANTGSRIEHLPDGSYQYRADQEKADKMLAGVIPNTHIFKGNFVWDLPDLKASGSAMKVVGLIINDWQFSGVWTGLTGTAYNVTYAYSNGGGNVNITGSPDFAGRVRIVGDTGSGCNKDDMYRQFNAAAFQGPLTNSDGLESPAGYLRGCFQSALDFTIARNIRMGGARNLQIRVDMFNAPNQAIPLTRNSSMTIASPTDQTVSNLPYDASGTILASRVKPSGSGFGQVQTWQAARSMQFQLRFSF